MPSELKSLKEFCINSCLGIRLGGLHCSMLVKEEIRAWWNI